MPVASSSSGQRLMSMGLDADSSCLLTCTTTAAVSLTNTGAVAAAAAAAKTTISPPCSDQQPIRSDDSSVSTNTDIFQSNNNGSNNNNNAKEQDEEEEEEDEDYSLQDAQTRISHALPQASEAAHALFGKNVGPCWGDFACTHHRIPGRFYATSCAILFYTNFLLGFERRVCLLLTDVLELQLFRTTSIKIQTMDMETYIFKSFGDRERVLHLLNGLKILADNNNKTNKHQVEAAGTRNAAHVQNSLYRHPPPPPPCGTMIHRNNSSSRVNDNNNMSSSLSRSRSASDGERRRQQQQLSRLPESDEQFNNCTATTSATPASVLRPTIRASSFSSLTGPFSKVPPLSAITSRSNHGIPPPPPFPFLSGNRRRAMSDSIVRSNNTCNNNSILLSTDEEEHPIPLSEPPLDHSFFMNLNDGMIAGGSVGFDFDSSFVQDDDRYNNNNNNNHVRNNINDTSYQSFYDDDEDQNLLLQQQQHQQQQQQQALESSWERAKQTHPTPTGEPLQEVGIDSITLSPCSLHDFFQHFLSDKAKYSLDWYQREYIKDTNVQISSWERSPAAATATLDSQQQEQDDDNAAIITTAFQRTMTFTHPINNSGNNNNGSSNSWSSSISSMMGPSAAQTTRHQHLQCFAGFGMVLTNKTLVQGIPACDAFYVQDKWTLEVIRRPLDAAQPPQLRISVRFEPHFTKRSLLKPIIQNSVRKETKDWMAGYVDMLQGAIKELTTLATSSALSSVTPTKPKTTLMVPTTSPHCGGGGDNDADASALLPMAAAATNAVVKPSTAAVVSTANDMAQQQQQGEYDVLVFAKSVQRLVALAIVLVILLGLLLLFHLVALQATLSTLQLQVQGVYIQNAMVMHQLQRQLLALQLQQIVIPAQ